MTRQSEAARGAGRAHGCCGGLSDLAARSALSQMFVVVASAECVVCVFELLFNDCDKNRKLQCVCSYAYVVVGVRA